MSWLTAVQSSPWTSASHQVFRRLGVYWAALLAAGWRGRDASKEMGQGALASQHHKILTKELGLVLNPMCTPFLKVRSASFQIRRSPSLDERWGCECAW